jgi:hypothetical protein
MGQALAAKESCARHQAYTVTQTPAWEQLLRLSGPGVLHMSDMELEQMLLLCFQVVAAVAVVCSDVVPVLLLVP